MPFKNSGEIRKCKWCDAPAKKYYIGNRFKGYCRTCGSEECLQKAYRDENICKSKVFQEERICEICNKCNLGLHYIEDTILKENMERYLKGEM